MLIPHVPAAWTGAARVLWAELGWEHQDPLDFRRSVNEGVEGSLHIQGVRVGMERIKVEGWWRGVSTASLATPLGSEDCLCFDF